MANEYLQRTPTSTGNRKVFTWSGWVKKQDDNTLNSTRFDLFNAYQGTSGYEDEIGFRQDSLRILYYDSFYISGAGIDTVSKHKDLSDWMHVLVSVDTTKTTESDRWKIYINGVLSAVTEAGTGYPNIYTETSAFNVSGKEHNLFRRNYGTGINYGKGQSFDVFFIDGQALTPEVFGYYKPDTGYMSVGTSQATKFTKGEWAPKDPKTIKSIINAKGGFGVNGFYLPMNSSNNFGADFHTTPNTILKLKEDLPQPKAEIDGAGDYTNALRDDPFKDYLIYAQPNVLGGLGNGYGDYSHIIRGSGTPKTIFGGRSGTPTISTTQSLYYGSSLYFDGNDTLNVETNDSNYLGRDFTIEFWVWHDSAYPINQMAFNTVPHTSFGISLNRGGSGQTSLFVGNGSNWQLTDFRSGGRLYSQQWNHVAVERYNNTITIYHNGVAQASYKQGDQVVTNSGTFTGVMPTGFYSLLRYGTYENTSGEPILGYIQDYRIYSGVAKYKGGFDVPRPYTPVGIATWRAVPDTTANNFATLNPLVKLGPDAIVYTDGNNTITNSGSAGARTNATFSINSGKWYYECRVAGINSASHILGWSQDSESTGDAVWVRSSGVKYSLATGQVGSAFPTWANGDFIMIAYDHSTRRLWAGKNGVWYSGQSATYSQPSPVDSNWLVQMTTTTGSVSARFHYDNVSGTKEFIANFGQNPTFSGNTTAGTFTDSNGKGLFKYQPPSGFLALCSDNLPESVISDPGEHFKTVLWTGDGLSRSISGVGFQPDLVWIKSRTNGGYFHNLVDNVRGPSRRLASNSINAEDDASAGGATPILGSFDNDGFSLPNGNVNVNESGGSYIAWCWKAGGEAVTNTNGTITSQVSANQDAGFSIVSWTGNGVEGATIGHGLNKTPKFIIQKNRDGGDAAWRIWHDYIGENYGLTGNHFLSFDTSALRYDSQRITGATTTTFRTTGTAVPYSNSSGTKFITYCWAEIEGFSKFGSYVGNGSADGPFVYCGFKPALVIVKSVSASDNWRMYDSSRGSTNPISPVLYPNLTNIETAPSHVDLLSNGFKWRTDNNNGSGITHIFAAFAESPFKTNNAK